MVPPLLVTLRRNFEGGSSDTAINSPAPVTVASTRGYNRFDGFEAFRGTYAQPGFPIPVENGMRAGELLNQWRGPDDCFMYCDRYALCTGFVHYTDSGQCAFRGGPGQSNEQLESTRTRSESAVLYVRRAMSSPSPPPPPLPPLSPPPPSTSLRLSYATNCTEPRDHG